jgi:hypothetical protein
MLQWSIFGKVHDVAMIYIMTPEVLDLDVTQTSVIHDFDQPPEGAEALTLVVAGTNTSRHAVRRERKEIGRLTAIGREMMIDVLNTREQLRVMFRELV